MQLPHKLLLLAVPGSITLGGMAIVSTNTAQSQPEVVPTPTQWKVQAVETPKIVNKTPHEVFLARQEQLANRDFSCDCNGCRVSAASVGIKLN
jgi:hypothetical protein